MKDCKDMYQEQHPSNKSLCGNYMYQFLLKTQAENKTCLINSNWSELREQVNNLVNCFLSIHAIHHCNSIKHKPTTSDSQYLVTIPVHSRFFDSYFNSYSFFGRSKLGILSRLPAELEMTNSAEVTDCSTSMFISHPRQNEQPLCLAVLTSLTGDIKMSTQGKSVYSILHVVALP